MGTRVKLKTTTIKSNLGKYLFAVCAENNAAYRMHVLFCKWLPTLSCLCWCAAQKTAYCKVGWPNYIHIIHRFVAVLRLIKVLRSLLLSENYIVSLEFQNIRIQCPYVCCGSNYWYLLLAMDRPYHASLARLFGLYLQTYRHLMHHKR
jgi:hypothetical protein